MRKKMIHKASALCYTPKLGDVGFKRQQERSLQSDAFNMQQEVAIKGIARSTFCVLHDTMLVMNT